jgi:hypothetical protein
LTYIKTAKKQLKKYIFLVRAVPFKSTWEGGGDIFQLVVGVKPYFFMLGLLKINSVGGGSND